MKKSVAFLGALVLLPMVASAHDFTSRPPAPVSQPSFGQTPIVPVDTDAFMAKMNARIAKLATLPKDDTLFANAYAAIGDLMVELSLITENGFKQVADVAGGGVDALVKAYPVIISAPASSAKTDAEAALLNLLNEMKKLDEANATLDKSNRSLLSSMTDVYGKTKAKYPNAPLAGPAEVIYRAIQASSADISQVTSFIHINYDDLVSVNAVMFIDPTRIHEAMPLLNRAAANLAQSRNWIQAQDLAGRRASLTNAIQSLERNYNIVK